MLRSLVAHNFGYSLVGYISEVYGEFSISMVIPTWFSFPTSISLEKFFCAIFDKSIFYSLVLVASTQLSACVKDIDPKQAFNNGN